MARPVLTPQPIQIGRPSKRYRHPGVHAAEALRLHDLPYGNGRVPSRLRLRVPKRHLFDAAQIIKPEAGLPQILLRVIMIEHYQIHRGVHFFIIETGKRHHIRSDGRIRVFSYYFLLHMQEGNTRFLLKKLPFQQNVRIVPGVCRRRNFVKAVVRLAEKIQIPAGVEGVDRPVFLFQKPVEFFHARRAEAAVARHINFVIQLPSDHILVAAELLRHGAYDGRGRFPVCFVV